MAVIQVLYLFHFEIINPVYYDFMNCFYAQSNEQQQHTFVNTNLTRRFLDRVNISLPLIILSSFLSMVVCVPLQSKISNFFHYPPLSCYIQNIHSLNNLFCKLLLSSLNITELLLKFL